MPKAKSFQERLRDFKEKNGLTHPQIGQLFDIGRGMAEQLHNGYDVKDKTTMNRYLDIITKLEKEPDVRALLKHKKKEVAIPKNVSELQRLIAEKDEHIEILESRIVAKDKMIETLRATIEYLTRDSGTHQSKSSIPT